MLDFVTRSLRKLRYRRHFRPFQAEFRRDVRQAMEASAFERKHLDGVARFPDQPSLLEHTLLQVSPYLETWVEIGVATGGSTRLIASTARKLGLAPTIHGFDSFQGLPEDFIPGVPKGSFATKPPSFSEDNIVIYQGWFRDTLPEFARMLDGQIGFLHADADLYSSTKKAFDALCHHLGPGTVILFDELWNVTGILEHEHRALTEFVDEAQLNYHYIGYNENYTQASIVLVPG